MTRCIAGIFVGGRGSRMGGVAKGLLELDSQPLVLRTWELCVAVGLHPVLVGQHSGYASLERETIADVADVEGPLAGLLALLAHAAPADGPAIAIACDMPRISADLLRALIDAPAAPVVAPKHDGLWEPLIARYDSSVLPIARRFAAAGERRLQALLDLVGAVPLALPSLAVLEDWDSPTDLPAGVLHERPKA